MSDEEIGENWGIIRLAIKNSAMPTADTNEAKMRNILKSLLSGMAVCWTDREPSRARTIVITTIAEEEVSLTRNLIIYCAHGFMKASSGEYLEMVKDLGKYAKEAKCDNIIAYVWNPKIVQLLKKYGAEANYTLVVFPLGSQP